MITTRLLRLIHADGQRCKTDLTGRDTERERRGKRDVSFSDEFKKQKLSNRYRMNINKAHHEQIQ